MFILNPGFPTDPIFEKFVNVDLDGEIDKEGGSLVCIPRFPVVEYDEIRIRQLLCGKKVTLNYFMIKMETLKEAFVQGGFEPLAK